MTYRTDNSLELVKSPSTDFAVRVLLNPGAQPDAELRVEIHFKPDTVWLQLTGELPETSVAISYQDLIALVNEFANNEEFVSLLRGEF